MTPRPRFVGMITIVAITLLTSANALAQCNITESFDGGFTHPWVVSVDTLAYVQNDVFTVNFQSSDPNEYHGAVLDPCVYTDLRASVRMRDLSGTRGKAIAFRNNGMHIGYNVNLRSAPFNDVVLGKGSFAPAAIISSAPFAHSAEYWVDVEVEAVGAQIKVWVNGNLLIDHTDPNPILSGWMFLGINAGGTYSGHAEFDDFSVIALDAAVPTETVSWGAFKQRF